MAGMMIDCLADELHVCSTGCVNALNWSPDGTLLASGSDDTRSVDFLGQIHARLTYIVGSACGIWDKSQIPLILGIQQLQADIPLLV
jgi:WD40 repeat protein